MNISKNILVIDDDPRICRMLKRYLNGAGYNVEYAHDGSNIESLIDTFSPSIVVLDLGLPGDHGFEIAKKLRLADRNLGIIICTGSTDNVDRVVGLELGADDYVAKPFEERELLARIRSTQRRVEMAQAPMEEQQSQVIEFGNLKLFPDAYEAETDAGVNLDLTTHEFQLLLILAENRSRVLDRNFILDHLSGRDWSPFDRSVDVLIGKLRKKLQKHGVQNMIVTVRNAGYKLVIDHNQS